MTAGVPACVLVALAVVVVVAIVEHHRRVCAVPPPAWLWLLAEVESHVDTTAVDPCDMVVGVCLHGPPPIRSAAEAVLADHAGAAPAELLAALCDRLATTLGDRLCATAAAAAGSGVDPATALARLRADEAALVAARCRIRGILRGGMAVCWLLLSPLGLVVAGVTTGGAAWVLAGLVVAAWWLGRRWIRAAVSDTRVLTGASVRALATVGPAAV